MKSKMENLKGKTIISQNGNKYRLDKMIGYGGQGVVYADDKGEKVIKLYYPLGHESLNNELLHRINYIKNIKTPKNFVKIIDVIDEPYVGYVMDKINDHKPLNSYLIPDPEMNFSDWYNQGRGLRERIIIGYIIAKAFGEIERDNLAYCDISGNNILVKADKAASVKMIDIDNLYVAGKGNAVILGTPRYIAPEVIKREKNPDVLSDNYSLAVILYELLRVGHPYISDDVLDGTPEDEEAALSGHGEYVTDENSTNMLPADVVFTDKLADLFKKCFVDGKTDRIKRPSAKDFEFALLEASNKIIECPHCKAWYYPRKSGKTYLGCPWCDQITKPRARLNFYDLLLEGDNCRTGNNVDTRSEIKPNNTYILREGKNRIKGLYVFKTDNPTAAGENHLTIAKNKEGYWVYNEFSVPGLALKKRTNDFIQIEAGKAERLDNGDFIYFETSEARGTTIEVGGKTYSFIRMARFVEEKQ